jgi:RNA polymerase sigma factor (sigma-70 family)
MARGQVGVVLEHLRRLLGGRGRDPTEDAQLLWRFVSERDEAAFASLLERYGPLVLRVCRNLLHAPHDVEDAFQATFLVFVRKAGSLARPDLLGPWLRGVAYRVAMRTRAQAARRREHERRAAAMSSPGLEETSDWRDLGAVLEEEVSRLPEKYRVPFVLCYLEGKTNEQAALCLGCPKGTVLSRLARARERLRTRLTRRGVAPDAALLGASLPAVPEALKRSTLRAALLMAAGRSAGAAGVSAEVVSLVQGVTQAMFLSKLSTAAVALLVVVFVGASALVLAHQALSTKPAKEELSGPPAADEAKGKPPAEGQARTDPFGDRLPDGALARMGTRRLRERGPVLALAFAPDGKTLASASSGEVHRWEVSGGKETGAWSLGTGSGGFALALSPNCRTAVWKHGGELVLWDMTAGKELRRLRGHRENVLCAAFSPDGKTLASADRTRAVLLWDVGTGQVLHQLTGQKPGGLAVAFSPDGKVLATGADIVRLWDVAGGKEMHQLAGSGKGVASVAFSPDGKTLASGEGDKTVRLWDPATGAEVRRLGGLTGEARPLAFAEGGKTLVAGVSGPDVRLWTWDVATGKELRRIGGSEEFLTCLAVSPDGKTVATGGVDRAIRLWDVAGGRKLLGAEGHLGTVGAVAFSPDGKTLATGAGAGLGGDHPILLWETATGKELGRLQHPQGRQPSVLAFSPDGTTLAALTNGVIEFWNPAARKLRDNRITDFASVGGFAYVDDGETIATVAGNVEAMNRLGHRIPGKVDAKWWDLATRKELHQLGGKDFTGVRRFALSADGRTLIVLSSKDNKLHLWDIAAGKERSASDPPRGAVSWTFSPDARVMAWHSGAEATIHLQETATGKEELRQLHLQEPAKLPRDAIRKVRMLFAPDGKLFAAALQQTIFVWDVMTGKELARFRSDQGTCEALAFSADGKLLASGGSDSTALVWGLHPQEKKEHR